MSEHRIVPLNMYIDYLSIKSKRKQKGKSCGGCANRRLSRNPLCEERAGVRVHVHQLSALILNRSMVSGRRLRLTPTGERCVVFQVPTPPNNNFSCYQIISHPAIPPSLQSYGTHAVSSWDLTPALGKENVLPSDSGAGFPVCASVSCGSVVYLEDQQP